MTRVESTPLLRAVGRFDLAVTALLALPGISHAFIRVIDWLGSASGLAAPLQALPAFAMFFVNLAGVLGVCWNLMILRSASYEMIRVNIVARWVVAALILYYVLAQQVTPVLLLFVVSEIFGSAVELRARPASAAR